jgi:hypothetical protein
MEALLVRWEAFLQLISQAAIVREQQLRSLSRALTTTRRKEQEFCALRTERVSEKKTEEKFFSQFSH